MQYIGASGTFRWYIALQLLCCYLAIAIQVLCYYVTLTVPLFCFFFMYR
jgi:hypothetical protein